MSSEFLVSFSRKRLAEFVEAIAGILLFAILLLPLLADVGNWLFPLGRDIIFKILAEALSGALSGK